MGCFFPSEKRSTCFRLVVYDKGRGYFIIIFKCGFLFCNKILKRRVKFKLKCQQQIVKLEQGQFKGVNRYFCLCNVSLFNYNKIFNITFSSSSSKCQLVSESGFRIQFSQNPFLSHVYTMEGTFLTISNFYLYLFSTDFFFVDIFLF